MRSVLTLLSCLGSFLLLTSCAATYRSIKPPFLHYPTLADQKSFSYRYDVLRAAGNKKLSKKEFRSHVRIVAVKLTNTTGRTLKYQQNFRIYAGGSEANLLDPASVIASVKQKAPLHFLYLLMTPMRLTATDGVNTSSTPIGLVLGPALALGNFAVAASANKHFKRELTEYSILDREIQHGETFHGLIAVLDHGYLPLTVKVTP